MQTRPIVPATALLLLAAATVALPNRADAQRRWDLSFQGGAALPIKDFGDAELRTGGGFEVTVSYRFLQHLAVYAGWDWHRFATDATRPSFAGPDVDVEETGYAFGLRFEHPLGSEGSPALVVRGGGMLNHTEIEDAEGGIISDSGHGLGWEIGAGLALPLGSRWRVVPGVRLRSLDRDQTIGTATTPVKLTYVEPAVRFVWSF